MSLHTPREWTPEEALAATSRELPSWIKTALGALFGIGLVIFIVGILVAPDRAWRAFHFNWLFFFDRAGGAAAAAALARAAAGEPR